MKSQPKKTRLTWFDTGYADARANLPSDPPQYPGHGSYKNYRDGYQCAERDMEREIYEFGDVRENREG